MRVLVTRPEPEARSFAEALAARGHEALLAPMLRLETLPPPDGLAEQLAAAQAILLTSVNGARTLAAATRVRGYRLIAVGDATETTARQLGFKDVVSAGGDAQALIGLVSQRLVPADGPLVHVGGVARAGDIAGALRAAAFRVEEIALYETRTVDALPADIVQAIRAGRVDAATFFSPRTAGAFVKLATQAGLAPHLAGAAAIAISPAALAAADGVPWRTRIAARAPTQDGVLAALEAVTPSSTGSPTMSDDKKPTAADPPSGGQTDAAGSRDDFRAPPDDTTAAPTTHPRRGVGVVGAFISGLVASVMVLGGALTIYAVQPEAVRGWFRPVAKDAGGAPVSREALAGALKPLDDRLAQLETRTRALDAVAAQATQIKELQDRLAAQETRLAAVRDLAARIDASPRGGDPEAAARLAAQLAQARQELAAVRADLASLKSRQETAESTIRVLTERPPSSSPPGTADMPADASRQIAVLLDRLDRLEKREAQVSGALSGTVDSAALARAIGEAEARLREPLVRAGVEIDRTREAAAKLAERVGALETDVGARLDAVRQDIAARGAGDRRATERDRAAAAIGIAARLRQAVDSGGPFMADADLLKPLAAADAVVAAIHTDLTPFAAAGVATRRALAGEFPEIARRVIAADLADDSWGERLLGKLKQLVSIRRVGDDTRGSTPEAILARAEAALEAGDLARSVGEMKGLQRPADAPARDWMQRAEAHLAAQRAVDRLSLHGIGLLSRIDPK